MNELIGILGILGVVSVLIYGVYIISKPHTFQKI